MIYVQYFNDVFIPTKNFNIIKNLEKPSFYSFEFDVNNRIPFLCLVDANNHDLTIKNKTKPTSKNTCHNYKCKYLHGYIKTAVITNMIN